MILWLITDKHNQEDPNSLSKKIEEYFNNFGINSRILFCNSKEDFFHELEKSHPDLIFSNQYWFTDNSNSDINTHQVFSDCDLPFVGSPSNTLEILINKARLKDIWKKNGISTPDYVHIHSRARRIELDIDDLAYLRSYPYIIKPNSAGNSEGIEIDCIVDDAKQLKEVLKRRIQEWPDLIIEEYLGEKKNFREFTIAQIGSGKKRIILPVEINNTHKKSRKIITTQDKDLHHTETIPVEPGLEEQLINFASAAFEIAGVHDYGRLDVLSTSEGLFALEINGQPMVPDRWFAGCASVGGLDEDQYLAAILFASAMRWNHQDNRSIPIPDQLKQRIPLQIIERLS